MIKICGITRLEDAAYALKCGADAIGFVFAKSKRQVSFEDARAIIAKLPPSALCFGVFVNPEEGLVKEAICRVGIDIVQLHGDEPVDFCASFPNRAVKVFRPRRIDELSLIKDYEKVVRAVLIDTWSHDAYGGTGKRLSLDIAVEAIKTVNSPVILAGGFSPHNIEDVLKQLSIKGAMPFGVDVSSGVEASYGKKDKGLIRQFIEKARAMGL